MSVLYTILLIMSNCFLKFLYLIPTFYVFHKNKPDLFGTIAYNNVLLLHFLHNRYSDFVNKVSKLNDTFSASLSQNGASILLPDPDILLLKHQGFSKL